MLIIQIYVIFKNIIYLKFFQSSCLWSNSRVRLKKWQIEIIFLKNIYDGLNWITVICFLGVIKYKLN